MFKELFAHIQLSSLKNLSLFNELVTHGTLPRTYGGYKPVRIEKKDNGTFYAYNVDRFSEIVLSINQDITLAQHLLFIYLRKIEDFDFLCHFLTEEGIAHSNFGNETFCFGPVDDTTFLKSKLVVSNMDRKENIVSTLTLDNNLLFFSSRDASFEQLYDYIFTLRKLTQKKRA